MCSRCSIVSSGEFHAAVGSPFGAADRIGGVDLARIIGLPALRRDRHQQVARDREHGDLSVIGVKVHEQQRVAVRRVVAVVGVFGAGSPVGAEDHEGLRFAAVGGFHDALGDMELARLGEYLVGDVVELGQCDRGGRRAAEQQDQDPRDRETGPHAPGQGGRALLIEWCRSGNAHVRNRVAATHIGRPGRPRLAGGAVNPRRTSRYARIRC